MPSERPLLMIPGPIELSPAVLAACAVAPPSHVAPGLIEDFGAALELMRQVWRAGPEHQPFAVSGGGTLAMDMAVCNLLDPGQRALVVNTGYFSDRMAEMLGRRGVMVTHAAVEPGQAPTEAQLVRHLERGRFQAVFATHVDTSTGVRVNAQLICDLAREYGALSVLDGVCATAAERMQQQRWGADVVLTASQKAIGLPAGLGLMVASPRALRARGTLSHPVPLSIDWQAWRPIMRAYESRRGSYFSTPPTTLIPALRVALQELVDEGMASVFARHERVGAGMRAAWSALGLELLPAEDSLAANTLSAIRYPKGVDAQLTGAIKARGVVVAGGLHPVLRDEYFRVGHMGYTTTQPQWLERTVRAVAGALNERGHGCDEDAAVEALRGAED